MTSASDRYRKLVRLRAKLRRLQARISKLEHTLAGKRYFFGCCSRQKKRA